MPAPSPENRGIALTGFMGAGKSSVGRALADSLGWEFIDLDAVLAERFGPIPSQFERDGEAVFRERESAELRALRSERVVLSTGGGTPMSAKNRGHLERRFRTVWLDVPFDVAAARIADSSSRPLWNGAENRLAKRRSRYASARLRVDGSGPIAAVVAAIEAAIGEHVERVELPTGAYDVTISRGFEGLARSLDSDPVVVTDSNVAPLWQTELGLGDAIVIPAGETHKTFTQYGLVLDALIARKARRDTPIVALGGGVVGDLVGFAAATLNRGCRLVQVPTTTLSMVDSSVGGKTGVNHPAGKNLIGAFHQPEQVWANLSTLSTLTAGERIAGLAEVLKMAVCLDSDVLDVLEAEAEAARDGDPHILEHLVAMSVRMKARVVAEDERESGRRMVLNAGHTVAHGLEKALDFGSMRHGEAVAIGLVSECAWAEKTGHAESGLTQRIQRIARALGLPTELPRGLDRRAVGAAMALDKKARRDTLWVPVPVRAGHAETLPVGIQHADALLTDPA